MKRVWTRIAALLAFAIGATAIAASAGVLRGWEPGYTVTSWLPLYNLAAGLLSALLIAPLLWIDHRAARTASTIMLAAHTVVFLLLVTQSETVARESFLAMTIRIAVWIVIVILATVQRHRERQPAAENAPPQPA